MASPLGRPEKPPCECRDCTKSFRTVEQQKQETYQHSRSLSDTEARGVVKDALKSIKDNWEWLFTQVDHNGELIEERWKRKTRRERSLSLQTAMGDFVLPREFMLRRGNPFPSPEEPARDRKALLLNYLTMNRLTIDPQRFIGMLWGRAFYTPRLWAIGDNQRLDWVWTSGSVKTDFSRLVLNIEPCTSQYWELVDWRAGIFKYRLAIGFPRAILLLEAQQTIMAFLKNVVNDILSAGLPEVEHREPFLYCNLLKYSSEDELWCSYLNQPFTGPRCFDIPHMANTMALTRSFAVAYHLRYLQTNPEYLKRMVFQVSAALGPGREEDYVLRQTVAEISYDIWNYWSWKLIVSACKNIIQQLVGFHTANSSQEREIWVLKTQAAFLELSILLNEQLEDRASYLPLLLSSRESFSRYFTRNAENQVVLNEQLFVEARNDDLFTLLWDISEIARSRHPTEVDVDTALALLEDRVRWNKAARDRIDERVYSCLSDLGAIHDFKSRLEVRRPAPDRRIARRFLKHGNAVASGYRILLDQVARKVRDTDFKNFDLPKAGAPSKGLRRFLKAMKLQNLRAEGLRPDGKDSVELTLGTFWYMMRFQRHWLFENGVRQKKCQWTAKDIESDLNHISFLKEGVGMPRINPKEQEGMLEDIEIPEITQPAVLPQNRNSCPVREESLTTSTEFATKTILGEKPNMDTQLADGKLKEVIIPVKDSWALIFKLATKPSEEQQKTVEWKTFLVFMEDLGYSARTSTFDCIFEPMFAKRVFVGKGQGNNVGEWKSGGAIDFRKPLPTGKLDGVMLKAMLGILGNYFAENGVVVRFRRTHKGKQNGFKRIRRTERTSLPMIEDWGEDEREGEEEEVVVEEEEEEEDNDDDEEEDDDEHYASMRKESGTLASIINQMQREGKGVAGSMAKDRGENDNSDSDVEMTDAKQVQEAAVSAEEDLGLGMGRLAEIVHEGAASDLNERAVDTTVVPEQRRIKLKTAEAGKTHESQKSESIEEKRSENKGKAGRDGNEAEDIQQLAENVDERQLRRKRTGNSQAETQQEDTEELVLSYNLRPRKRQKRV